MVLKPWMKWLQQRLHHLCKHLASCACMHKDQRILCWVSTEEITPIVHLVCCGMGRRCLQVV